MFSLILLQFQHNHSPSVDTSHYHKGARSIPSAHSHPGYEHEPYAYEGGTFPRKKENQRFRYRSMQIFLPLYYFKTTIGVKYDWVDSIILSIFNS